MHGKVELNLVNYGSNLFFLYCLHLHPPLPSPSETQRRQVGVEECTLALAQWKPFVER